MVLLGNRTGELVRSGSLTKTNRASSSDISFCEPYRFESERLEAKRTGGLVEPDPERDRGRAPVEEEDPELDRRWGLKEYVSDELLIEFRDLEVEMVTFLEDERGTVLLVYVGGDGAVGDGIRRGLSDFMTENNQSREDY